MQLYKSTILAYTDICAVGCRALLGLTGSAIEENTSELRHQLGNERAACHNETNDMEQISVWHCKKQEVSVIIINSIVNDEHLPLLLNKIMDLCSKSMVERLYIPTVLRVELKSSLTDKVYENAYHGTKMFDLNSLPDETRISDPFLLTLMPFIQIEGIPTSCIIVPGYKAKLSTLNDEDGSLAATALLQKMLAAKLDLEFDLKKSEALVYKGKQEADDDPVTNMYS